MIGGKGLSVDLSYGLEWSGVNILRCLGVRSRVSQGVRDVGVDEGVSVDRGGGIVIGIRIGIGEGIGVGIGIGIGRDGR